MMAVFLVHLIAVLFHEHPCQIMDFCRVGTDMFLVLTGCLVYLSLRSRPVSFAEFLARRLARVYPVFAIVLIFYIAASAALPEMSRLPAGRGAAWMILKNAALVPLAFGAQRIITVSWTLGCICLFYVVIHPLAVWTSGWSLRRRTVLWSLLTLLVYAKAGRPALLPAGVLLAEWMPAAKVSGWILVPAAGAAARAFWGNGHLGTILGGIGALALCSWLLPRPTPRPLLFLSRISYSFYLTHGLALLAVAHFAEARWAAVPTAAIFALMSAYIMFRLVELPFSPIRETSAAHFHGRGLSPASDCHHVRGLGQTHAIRRDAHALRSFHPDEHGSREQSSRGEQNVVRAGEP